jgi:hypothetical protein
VFSYNSQLLTEASAPRHSVDDVIRGLQAIDAICQPEDGLQWFNRLYLEVTQAVADRVAAGGFLDGPWVSVLDVEFAALYFSALRDALSSAPSPGCWRALFSRRNQPDIARIQFALAGVNAHINRDLPVAVVSACRALSRCPSHGSTEYADYCSVNATLETLVQTAKQQLGVRLLGEALPEVSHLEQTLAAFSVTAAREAAWNNAEMLWILRGFPAIASRALNTLDGLTTLASKALLVPVPQAAV